MLLRNRCYKLKDFKEVIYLASVGDKVQIRGGAIDVTNGRSATAGKLYGEGGPLWCNVVAIVDNWNTGSKYGLPATVTKVRCASADGTIVWQVQPQDLAGASISPEPAPSSPPTPAPKEPVRNPEPQRPLVDLGYADDSIKSYNIGASNGAFAPQKGGSNWASGVRSSERIIETGIGVKGPSTASMSNSMFASNAEQQTPTYEEFDPWPQGRDSAIPKTMRQLGRPYRAKYKTSWQNSGRKREMLNQDVSMIQNSEKFPYHIGSGGQGRADKYDYQIIPGDTRYSRVSNLEDMLEKQRANAGIQVHGSNDIARSVKYYMYNRFKVPDTNLAHNRSFTHVFFTRPDCNILNNGRANEQTINHTDASLLWHRHPEIFKLLTDRTRTNDPDNFNLLLSNQINSFQLEDETIEASRTGTTWGGHEMVYGEQYGGRTAGTFSCGFTETSDYSVFNLIKLWMTYIDNVSRGAWSPYYGIGNTMRGLCPVAERAIDYGASLYVFKCGVDGEDVLYWSKYYGIFPVTSGASALGWDLGTTGDVPKLNIQFAYSFKRDMSPISLLEFNNVSDITDDVAWIPAYDNGVNQTARPYVGSPYIEIDLGAPETGWGDSARATKRTQVRLKFKQDTHYSRKDSVLYRAHG